jgi:hypothetical protein
VTRGDRRVHRLKALAAGTVCGATVAFLVTAAAPTIGGIGAAPLLPAPQDRMGEPAGVGPSTELVFVSDRAGGDELVGVDRHGRSPVVLTHQVPPAQDPSAPVSWERPKLLSTRGVVYSVHVGVDAQGDVAAVWIRTSSIDSFYDGAVYAAVRPAATQSWSPVLRLSTPPAGQGGTEGASLFVTPAGNALVVWNEGDEGKDQRVFTVTGRLQTGRWGTPRLLGHGTLADVGIDGSRTATVLWWRAGRLLTTSGDIASNRWGAPQRVPIREPRKTLFPELAVGSRGDSLVSWTYCEPGDRYPCRLSGDIDRRSALESSFRPRSKPGWQPRQLIVQTDRNWPWNYGITATAVDSHGDATAAWITDESVIETANSPSSGPWRYAGQVPESSGKFDAVNGRSYVALRVDGANDRLLVFGADGLDKKTGPDVFALRAIVQRPQDAGWHSSTLLDWTRALAPGSVFPPGLRVASSGKAIATWYVRDALQVEQGNYSTRWLQVQLGDLTTDTWQPPQKLWRFSDSDRGGGAAGATSTTGRAAVIWSSERKRGPAWIRVAVTDR